MSARANTAGMWDIFNVNRETSNVELNRWGKEHIPGFLGVVPRDKYGQLYHDGMKPGSSAIINLDFGNYARGGTHWVAARVSSEAPLVLYFDAYGLPPPTAVSARAHRSGRGVVWTDIQQQGDDEVNCGPRALAALHWLADAASHGKELSAFAELGQIDDVSAKGGARRRACRPRSAPASSRSRRAPGTRSTRGGSRSGRSPRS